jgi:type IV pilus assembly protein PilN
MIRINLMPRAQRRANAETKGQGWLLAAMAAALVAVVVCFVVYGSKQEELEGWQRKTKQVQAEIELSKGRVGDHEKIKQDLQKLRDREEAINRLQSARSGPTAMLLEIARLMTRGRGPSVLPEKLAEIEQKNPLAKFNPEWDSRRIWLTEFLEDARRVVLKGQARDGEDVSELARRMNLSTYFYDVKLLPAKREDSKNSQGAWVSFQLEARVRY